MSVLNDIFIKHNCDKGTAGRFPHHYYLEYEKEFEKRRYDKINILEVGIWKGTSFKSFYEYFPNANIYGIDVLVRMDKIGKLINDPRTFVLKEDSTNNKLPDIIRKNWGDVEFDIIIDDGLHTPNHNSKTFKNLMGFLKADGVYYIEDFCPIHLLNKKQKEEIYQLYDKHPENKQTRDSHSVNQINDLFTTLLSYHFESIDLREQSGRIDSFLIKIDKNKKML